MPQGLKTHRCERRWVFSCPAGLPCAPLACHWRPCLTRPQRPHMHADSTATAPSHTGTGKPLPPCSAATVDGQRHRTQSRIAELTEGADAGSRRRAHPGHGRCDRRACLNQHKRIHPSGRRALAALGTGRGGWRRTGGVSVRLNREANGRIGSLGQFAVGPNMWNPNSLARCGHS
jgi:hypothetical protein